MRRGVGRGVTRSAARGDSRGVTRTTWILVLATLFALAAGTSTAWGVTDGTAPDRAAVTGKAMGGMDVLGAVAPAGTATPGGAVTPAGAPFEARHTYLTGSVPSADSRVPMPVEEIRFFFSTPVQRALSSVTVTGPDGSSVPGGEITPVPGADDEQFLLPFQSPLPEGRYEVRWRTAGPDDHPVQGTFSFTVEVGNPADQLDIVDDAPIRNDTLSAPGAADPGAPGRLATGDAPQTREAQGRPETAFALGPDARLRLGVRWLFYLSIVGMIGTVIFRIGVVRPLSRPPEFLSLSERALTRTRSLAWIMGILGLVMLLPRLLLQSSAIFGSMSAGQLSTVIFQSAWGLTWLLHAFFALIFLAGLIGTGAGGRNARGWGVMAFAAVGMAFIPALSGHAWGAEEMRTIVVLSTFLHVFAGGVWLGGLMVLLFAGLPALRRGAVEERVDEASGPKRKPAVVGLSSMVNAFSRLAVVAVAILVLTGAVSAWVHLESPGDLIGTGYGRTLLVKVGVALAAFALGFYNWKVVRPSLRERQETGILRIPASLEFFIGLLVLVITALLVSQSLP